MSWPCFKQLSVKHLASVCYRLSFGMPLHIEWQAGRLAAVVIGGCHYLAESVSVCVI